MFRRLSTGPLISKSAIRHKALLKITPTAISRLKELSGNQLLRITTKNKGCSGQVYALEYVDKKQKLDEEVNQDGVTVLVDSRSLLSLIGSEMDYVEDILTSQFVFKNPNITGICGCGQSFTT
jgi:iron-sulfur cluster assembly accessory protein